jgi:hypothetical protein
MKNSGTSDGKVSMEEFVEYYKNISCSIDNEEYFELMINNSWNIKGNAATYASYKKSWKAEEDKPQQKPVYIKPQQPVQ